MFNLVIILFWIVTKSRQTLVDFKKSCSRSIEMSARGVKVQTSVFSLRIQQCFLHILVFASPTKRFAMIEDAEVNKKCSNCCENPK